MKPLTGCSVVICRPEDQTASLAAELGALGATVCLLPLIAATSPPDDGRALDDELARVDSYDWVVFTSANGVRAVVDSPAFTDLDRCRVGVIGSATENAAAELGIGVDVVSPVATGAHLASAIPLDCGKRILAPLALLAGPDLVDGLVRRGFEVTRVDAYSLADVELAESAVARAAAADAVLFTSPSIVDRFLAAVANVPPIRISIGPRTTARAQSVGVQVTSEANPHTEEGLIDALLNTIKP